MVMLQQTAQTKHRHQAHLHTMENIFLAQDTRLDPLLNIIKGTDTGLADLDHVHALTETEVTVEITQREVTERSYHRCPHRSTSNHRYTLHATDTQTLIITNGTHHIGGLPHIEAHPHILETTVGLDHICYPKLAEQHLLNLLTALTRQHRNTRITNIERSPLMTPPCDYYSSDE